MAVALGQAYRPAGSAAGTRYTLVTEVAPTPATNYEWLIANRARGERGLNHPLFVSRAHFGGRPDKTGVMA